MEIRRSYDRLIFTIGFPILVRLHLYTESGLRALLSICICKPLSACSGYLRKRNWSPSHLQMSQQLTWGFQSPSGRDIFCLKNFDTLTRTPVRVSKMNAVARAQLTFQMLTLLQKYLCRQSQYSKHGTANGWP